MRRKRKIHYKRNLKEYFRYIAKYKFLFWIMIFSVTITEALFVADKFLYKWLIDDAENLSKGIIELSAFSEVLLLIAIIFTTLVVFRSLGKYLSSYFLAKLDVRLIYDLKKKYFSHIVELSHKFHSEHKTGSLISRLNRGTRAIEGLTDVIVFQISPLVLQVVLVLATFLVFAKSSALILGIISVLFISYSIYVQRIQSKQQVPFNRASDKESGFISDVLTNIETVKYFGREKVIENKFQKIIESIKKRGFTFFNTYSYLSFGQNLIIGLGTVAILYFPLMEFMNQTIPLSTLVFIYALYGNVVGRLFQFMGGIRGFYRSMGDFEDLFEYGEIENEIKDAKNAKTLKIKNGEIEFKNISFGYTEKGKKNQIFKNFNLKIKPNEKVAFVGHSGSGKTSLVKLINRLYDVDRGEITIDGVNIKEFTQQSVRSETSIVPQECILFDDTIYNNILFANPQAKRKDVILAMKQAQLESIIKRLPNKEKTIVGERGVKLSGGEKQRVSIARAILANKKILILDEATSALDSRTENSIAKALHNLLRSRTSIIVAHRLSTIMNSDRIIVLKNGKIVEEGNHKDLIKKNGEYASLWDLQSSGYISE